MRIIFDTEGYMGRRNFKPDVASRLFRRIWDWYEIFDGLICNDKNIEIDNVSVKKESGNPFDECLSITIHGKVYGFIIEEKIHFFLVEIFSQKQKANFAKKLTLRFTERLERIKFSIDEQHSTIEETMSGLTSK